MFLAGASEKDYDARVTTLSRTLNRVVFGEIQEINYIRPDTEPVDLESLSKRAQLRYIRSEREASKKKPLKTRTCMSYFFFI